jgi:hypothetical protein
MPATKSVPKPKPTSNRFVLFWWVECPDMRMAIYRTRGPEDVEVFSDEHLRVTFHPDSSQDERVEVILQKKDETWWVKVDDQGEDWCYYDEDSENGVWTWMDEPNQELFVIREMLAK